MCKGKQIILSSKNAYVLYDESEDKTFVYTNSFVFGLSLTASDYWLVVEDTLPPPSSEFESGELVTLFIYEGFGIDFGL